MFKVFAPGEICEKTGIFRVRHYQHRFPHDVLVAAGEAFPECRRCRNLVRFQQIPATEVHNPVAGFHDDSDLELKDGTQA